MIKAIDLLGTLVGGLFCAWIGFSLGADAVMDFLKFLGLWRF